MSGSAFDSVLVVDWSARSTPSPRRCSPNAVWWCLARRDGASVTTAKPEYARTRSDALDRIARLIRSERAEERSVLAGFDFPFGYPAGVAEHITREPSALALWGWLDERIEDRPDNANNRFDVAGEINRLYDGVGPFWGRPAGWDVPDLPARAHARDGADHPPERRLADRQAPGAKTVWQLHYAGSVGSQVLLGLPALKWLRCALGGETQIWPFETGLAAPEGPVVLAEVYPSLIGQAVAASRAEGETLDAAQVRVNATRFARLAADGALAPLFAPAIAPEERHIVETEEAWILGLGHTETLDRAARAGEGADHAQLVPATDAGCAAPASERGPRAARSRRIGSGSALVPAHRAAPARRRPSLCAADDRPAVSAPPPLRYERDPVAIYRKSFATVEAETRLDHLPPDLRPVAVRLVHACGMPDITARLAWSDEVVPAAHAALAAGAPVLCDCAMVASGVIRGRLPAANPVLCTLDDAGVPELARAIENTRSAAAVELWDECLAGAVVAIGNAPTALFHLLELIDAGAPRPAAILGFPVGFVGAAESKAELARHPRGVAFLTLRGRRGGSAMAAAAVNALAAEDP